MNTRLRARGQEETPTIHDRRGILVELNTLKVRLAILLIKVIFACRALFSPCPDFGAWPQFDLQPLFESSDSAEVRQYVSRHDSLDGAAGDVCFAFDGAHGRITVRAKGFRKPLDEDLSVHRRDRSASAESACRPGASRQIGPRSGVTSRPGHGVRLPSPPCRVSAPCYSNGTCKTHSGERQCQDISSSEVTS